MNKKSNEDPAKVIAVVYKPPYFNGEIFTIPVKVEKIEIPKKLKKLLGDDEADKLRETLGKAKEIIFPQQPLPIVAGHRIAFYAGKEEAKDPQELYVRRIERLNKDAEILSNDGVLATYEPKIN